MSSFSRADNKINRLLLVLAVTTAPRCSFNYLGLKWMVESGEQVFFGMRGRETPNEF